MRWVGHQRVRVLDGGLHQWQNLGYPLSTTEPQFESTEYMPSDSIARICTAHDILKGSQTLIDARAYDRFQGKNETLDHTGGHIPSAVCYPFVENQAPDKTFIANSDRFNAIDKNKDIVCYCGSGISATHNILALLLAGFPEPMLYPGSWSEWIEDPNRPIA